MKLHAVALASASLIVNTTAQNLKVDLSTFFNITTFPSQQWKNVSNLLSEAQTLAGPDLYPYFIGRCVRAQAYPELNDAVQLPGFVPSHSPFKNVFFVGQSAWSSWAIDTGNRELLLIDTLGSPIEAEKIILPGLASHGYSGSDIKAIVITHEHSDHYGGAAYLQQHFNPIVYASQTAWLTMSNSSYNPPYYKNYTNARSVADNETITLNDFFINVQFTPGHTPGCISLTFPVFDNVTQTQHLAGLYGGGGIPSAASAKTQQVESFKKFSALSKAKGVDVQMSNHQSQDNALWNFDLLRYRDCAGGKCSVENPFVVGTDAYYRYLRVMALCVEVAAARAGQDLSVQGLGKRVVESVEDRGFHDCEH